MHIAIVIPAFNAAAFLADAIHSVLAQSHRDWSLVVVDDGSTDKTAAIMAGFQDQRIFLSRQNNAGVSAARNAGIGVAVLPRWPRERADVPGTMPTRSVPDAFLFLDADDWLARTALAVLADTLDSAPWAVAAVGRFARVGTDNSVRLAPPPPRGSVLERLLTRNLFANGGHLLIRREALEAAGGFRTELSYGEDWEYWTRLALLGEFVSVACPAPVLFVRERLAGAYLSRATDPDAYRPGLDAVYRNPALIERLGPRRLAALRRRADAEMAWTVGRELVRHGRRRDGLRWLVQSVRGAPSSKRLMLFALSWLRLGPFRPYRTVG